MSSTLPPEINNNQGTVSIASTPEEPNLKASFIHDLFTLALLFPVLILLAAVTHCVAVFSTNQNAEQPDPVVHAAQHQHLVGEQDGLPVEKLLHIRRLRSSPPPTMPTSESSKDPIRRIAREDLTSADCLIGGLPWLFNKDRTRYGGEPLVPKELIEIADCETRNVRIAEFFKMMSAIPLTEEDKRQRQEWHEILMGPMSDEPLDDDIVDAVMAWSEGRGEFPF